MSTGARERRTRLTVDEPLALLAETPRRIAAATAGFSKTRANEAPMLGEWTLRDVIAHLRSCSDARGEFTRAMLERRRPTLRAIDPRSLIEETDYRELDFAVSFRAFTRQRARLLSFLRALPRASWSRTAIVTGGGPPRERTVLFYAQWVARHEQVHVDRIERFVRPAAQPKVSTTLRRPSHR